MPVVVSTEQWSPLNPDGKKKYDRSFLMDLRNDPQSQKKPDGLPEMEVVLKESNKVSSPYERTNVQFGCLLFFLNVIST